MNVVRTCGEGLALASHLVLDRSAYDNQKEVHESD
jgi:hypothetical protein